MASKIIPHARTDPAVYAAQHASFQRAGLPTSAAAWIARASEVAQILSVDAGAREAAGASPFAEISLLKSAGLLKALGPRRLGGGGQPWSVGYRLIREVARGDGSIAMLLGYHLLWSTTANVVGTAQQAEQIQALILRDNLFIGGAVNPRDADLAARRDGDVLVFDGKKNFSTGGVISDLTVLEGAVEGAPNGEHVFTFVPTNQPGIVFQHNWDNIGLRLSESGGVTISNVRVPWSDALGWDANTRAPDQSVLGIPFSTLLLPTIQMVFSSFYAGIGRGALDAGVKYTATKTRAWPYGGDDKDKAVDEWYILERYGDFRAHLDAADALLDRAAEAVDSLYSQAAAADGYASGYTNGATNGATNGHANGYTNGSATNGHATTPDIHIASPKGRAAISLERRGDVAATVATAKIVTTDTALRVTAGVYEVLGASATASKYGFDRFWRDVRTHTLHDPVAYKRREVGRWTLLGERPAPTWYT